MCYKPTHAECFCSRACRSKAFDRAGTPEVKRGLASCSPAEKKPSCSKSGFVCHRTKVLAILQAHAGIYCPLAPIAWVAAQIGLQREARRNLLIRGKHPPTPRKPSLRCPSHLLIKKASFHGFLGAVFTETCITFTAVPAPWAAKIRHSRGSLPELCPASSYLLASDLQHACLYTPAQCLQLLQRQEPG